ncbi:MAG: acyltransferase domain-containing protein, partial [Planctomycetota bacterium]|nr:acyltransferase domain-containing protein [Planctomycetota bacterium]
MSWGVVPDAVIGHSAGELAAACLAGVFSLEDALQLAVERGRVTDRTGPGAMLLVALSEDQLAQHLSAEISLAAVNGPEHGVVSGSPVAIDALAGRLYERGVSHVR